MDTSKPNPPFPSYRGSGPYAFICYAHNDAHEVYPDLNWLREQGLNVWYDEGISPGRQWRDELAEAIDRCAVFIAFLSDNAVESPHCRKEIAYAINGNKRFVAIYLKETQLTPGLSLSISDLQALLKFQYSTDEYHSKMNLMLSDMIDLSAESQTADDRVARHQNGTRPRLGKWANSLAWAAALIVSIFLLARLALFSEEHTETTIAVLPFENFTGNPENDYISMGIAEEVINLLESLNSLRVVGRTASFYFAGKDIEFTTIAERLHADVILEGSLRRDDNRIRIAAQLINGKTGLHEWSEVFERDWNGLLSMQQQIALQVATALADSLTDDEVQMLSIPPTADEEAYTLYLEGRNYLRLAERRAELETAKKLFNQAIARDPRFLRAQSGVCDTELAIYQLSRDADDYARASSVCARLASGAHSDPEALLALGTLNRLVGNYTESLSLYDESLAIRPDSEPAYYGRGRALQRLGRLSEAEASLKKSVELQPGYWQSYSGYGLFLAETGRIAESIVQFRMAVELTPENPQALGNLGSALFINGDWTAAESAWRRSLELEPTGQSYINVGTALYYQSRFEEAVAIFDQGTHEFPALYRLWGKLGAAQAATGNQTEAEVAFEQAIALTEPLLQINAQDPYALAFRCVYRARLAHSAGLGDCEKAALLAPEDPEIHYLRATALQLSGKKEAAQLALGRAVQLGYSEKMLDHDPAFASQNP